MTTHMVFALSYALHMLIEQSARDVHVLSVPSTGFLSLSMPKTRLVPGKNISGPPSMHSSRNNTNKRFMVASAAGWVICVDYICLYISK